jgi:hypothetical protein
MSTKHPHYIFVIALSLLDIGTMSIAYRAAKACAPPGRKRVTQAGDGAGDVAGGMN